MNRVIRLFSIGILSVFLFGIASTQDVLACSGGSDKTLNQWIDETDIIVEGRIVEIDDANYNFIIQTDMYVKGNGAEHLLVALYNPARTIQDMYRSYYTCSYPPSGLHENMELLLFLNRRDDGAYVASSEVDYYIKGESNGYSATYNEFINEIQEYIGTESTPPNTNSIYPLHAPLLITTESGEHYLYPIDKQEPIPMSAELLSLTRQLKPACWERNCRAWSPNGLYNALLDEDGQLIINPNSGEFEMDFYWDADAIIFSPIENKLAILKVVGDKVEISIAILYEYYTSITGELFTQLEIDAHTISPDMLVWSVDGRMIAYSDNRGVWLWDVFTESYPQLVIVTDMPIQHFSPLGRYLTIGTDESGLSFDIISRQIFPAGVMSPDENYIVQYGTRSLTHRLSPFRPDLGDVVGNGIITGVDRPYNEDSVVEVYWTSIYSYLVRVCSIENIQTCVVKYHDFSRFNNQTSEFISAFDFAVHPQTGDIVIVTSREKLSFDMNQTEYDLSDILDSPIASIEWLPSLFYYDD